jgi:hypothetical protein
MHPELELPVIEWENVTLLCATASVFLPATEITEGEKFPTLSVVVPTYNALLDAMDVICGWSKGKRPIFKGKTQVWKTTFEKLNPILTAAKPEAVEIVQIGAAKARDILKKYYEKTPDECNIATVLDPRFNIKFYETDCDDSIQPDEIINS